MSGELLTVDGVSMKTLAKNVETLGATLRAPGQRGSNSVVAGRTGSVWSPRKPWEEASYVWPIWVLGCRDDGSIPTNSTQEFFARVDELTALFGKAYGLLDIRHTQPDGSVRQALCEAPTVFDMTTSGANPVGRVNVELVNPASFWRDVVAFATGDLAATTVHTPAVMAGSTAPLDDATFVIKGAITNPRITDVTSGAFLQYNGTIASGQSLTINTENWSLLGSGFTANYAALQYGLSGGPLLRLFPRPTQRGYSLQLTGSSISGATVSVAGNRKFLVG